MNIERNDIFFNEKGSVLRVIKIDNKKISCHRYKKIRIPPTQYDIEIYSFKSMLITRNYKKNIMPEKLEKNMYFECVSSYVYDESKVFILDVSDSKIKYRVISDGKEKIITWDNGESSFIKALKNYNYIYHGKKNMTKRKKLKF